MLLQIANLLIESAFGFVIFLPFLMIDLVVGAVLLCLIGGTVAGAAALGWRSSVWEAAKSYDRSSETVYRPDRARQAYFDQRFKLFLDAYKRNAPWFRAAFEGSVE